MDYIKQVVSKLPGQYTLDSSLSILNDYKSGYSDLELSFTKDHKFNLSEKVPFLTDSFGTWRYVFENEVAYLEMNFNKSLIKEQVLRDSNLLIFKYPQPIYGSKPAKEIILKRQAD